MSFNKEITFIKQVERTAKRDAYESVLHWAKNSSKEDIIYYLNRKLEGHNEYLNQLPYEYCYATQTLIPKTVKQMNNTQEGSYE